MISLPLPLKNLLNTNFPLIEENSDFVKENVSEQEKFAISIKEMQTISCALLIYAKHLEKRELGERASNARTLEERIFHYLQAMP